MVCMEKDTSKMKRWHSDIPLMLSRWREEISHMMEDGYLF